MRRPAPSCSSRRGRSEPPSRRSRERRSSWSGGAPGEVSEPDGWELWAPLNPLYEAGDYAAAVERGRETIEAYPEYPALFYNLACCESLAGLATDAVGHLRRSIELSERFRALAKDDADFDPIRDEPAFRELVGA
jgi:tetratricopeptide (TPR) repeat protein